MRQKRTKIHSNEFKFFQSHHQQPTCSCSQNNSTNFLKKGILAESSSMKNRWFDVQEREVVYDRKIGRKKVARKRKDLMMDFLSHKWITHLELRLLLLFRKVLFSRVYYQSTIVLLSAKIRQESINIFIKVLELFSFRRLIQLGMDLKISLFYVSIIYCQLGNNL